MVRRWFATPGGVLLAPIVVAASAAIAMFAFGRSALAEPGAVDLHVDCSSLTDDARSLLEARARAELLTAPLPKGDMSFVCIGRRATVSWQPSQASAGPSLDHAAVLPFEDDGTVDTLLGALHDLLGEWARQPPPRVVVVAPPPAPDAGLPASSSQGPLAIAIPPEGQVSEDASHRVRPPALVAAAVGVDGELWHGGIAGAIGAHGGVRVRLGGAWHASLVAGPLFGVGSPDGASAWSLRAMARVDYELVPHLEINLGLDGRIVWAHTPESAAESATTGGVLLGVRYAASLGPIGLSLGPSIEALSRPVAIDVGATESFRVPTLLAGLTIEATYP